MGLLILGLLIWGIVEAVRGSGGDSNEGINMGVQERSSDLLELDPRMNVTISETTPLTIVLVVGGVVFIMVT